MNYVEYNVWTGKIYKVSSISSLPTKSDRNVIEVDDPIIQDISDDKIVIESVFIGTANKAYIRSGIIHLIKREEEYTEILNKKIDLPDVSIILYTNNKLMDITINYSALKTWYNHRMKKDFKFNNNYLFAYMFVNSNNEIIKKIKIPSEKFLETFQATIDLSDIDSLENIKVSTKRMFPKYQLTVKENKYYNTETVNESFNKVISISGNRKDFNIIISKTNEKNTLLIELNKLDTSKIYKSLDFYITGSDPNELHEILSIPIEKLWNRKFITVKTECEINNKSIWCNSKMLNILLNPKVATI